MGLPARDLRRAGSARKSKGKCGPCGQQLPGQDGERTICNLIAESPDGELLSPVYNEPYSVHSSQRHPAAPPPHLDLSSVRETGRAGAALPPGKGRAAEERGHGSRFPRGAACTVLAGALGQPSNPFLVENGPWEGRLNTEQRLLVPV